MDCRAKNITLQTPDGELTVMGHRSNPLDKVVSATLAHRMLRHGCEAYLFHMVEVIKPRAVGGFIPTISKYLVMFPKDLPRSPPAREVEFTIELVPGAVPVSMALYWMALAELKELKLQLQELLDKSFIRPSVSP